MLSIHTYRDKHFLKLNRGSPGMEMHLAHKEQSPDSLYSRNSSSDNGTHVRCTHRLHPSDCMLSFVDDLPQKAQG